MSAIDELAKEQLFGERTLDELLNDARHGPCAHLGVVAALRDPTPRRLVHGNRHALLFQLSFGLHQDLVHHPLDGVLIQAAELNDGIQSIAELG